MQITSHSPSHTALRSATAHPARASVVIEGELLRAHRAQTRHPGTVSAFHTTNDFRKTFGTSDASEEWFGRTRVHGMQESGGNDAHFESAATRPLRRDAIAAYAETGELNPDRITSGKLLNQFA